MLVLNEGHDPELVRRILDIYERREGDFVLHDSHDFEIYIELYTFFIDRFERERKPTRENWYAKMSEETDAAYREFLAEVMDILALFRLPYLIWTHGGIVSVQPPKGGFVNVR